VLTQRANQPITWRSFDTGARLVSDPIVVAPRALPIDIPVT